MKHRLPWIAAALVLGTYLVGSYVLFRHFGYVSAPGGDLYNHAMKVALLQEQGVGAFFAGYPKLFHALVLLGVEVSGKDALRVMLAYLPLVVGAAGAVSFLLLKRLQGSWAGVLALGLTLWVATQPLQTLYDGGFPNYISVAVWLPLVLLGVSYLEDTKKKQRVLGGILIALGVILMMLTHHFSVAYLVILFVAGCVISWRLTWKLLLAGLVAMLAFLLSPLSAGVRDLASAVVQFGGAFPWIHLVGTLDNPNALISVRAFPEYFTPLIWWGGFAALVWVCILMLARKPVPLTVKLLAVLTFVLLVCSQMEVFGFPLRLARDAGVPLLFLFVYGAAHFTQKAFAKDRVWGVASLLFLALFLLPSLHDRFERMTHFEPAMQYTPAQDKIASYDSPGLMVALDQLLPVIAHPKARPYEFKTEFLFREDIVQMKCLIMIEAGDAYVARIEGILKEYGFVLIERETDPLKSVRLYCR
ncbi:MAG: hypothetical protein ACAH35_03395 [Candidatus Paceibacterota bacterium]